MDKLITVIIPSYNMEAYLERCVRSLLCPGYQRIEAIIVNDGSHDGTLKLARALEAERPDMVRVIDKTQWQLRLLHQCGPAVGNR
jgi:glycosyltransferase involved in cell wall biosynthesis